MDEATSPAMPLMPQDSLPRPLQKTASGGFETTPGLFYKWHRPPACVEHDRGIPQAGSLCHFSTGLGPPMETARLILDPAADGAWNMSVDQALLETADSTGLISLRFYTWSQPTLSLGYFQSHLDRKLHRPSLDCQLVRRRTGGGAILHDNELTYSLCVPSKNRWSKKNSELYRLVHRCIIELLAEVGIVSELFSDSKEEGDTDGIDVAEDPKQTPQKNAGGADSIPTVDQRSFMCFNRRSDGDIVIRGHKVVGSAQRRIKNSLLQHGSILLKSSRFAPNLRGVADLNDFGLQTHELSQMLAARVIKCLRVQAFEGVLEEPEIEAAQNAHSLQFNSQQWNQQR